MIKMLLRILAFLDHLDRRIIYIFIALALSLPSVMHKSMKPAEIASATKAYEMIESLSPEKAVLISLDWGPNTLAENKPQSEVIIEHLLRRRIPFAIMSAYALAAPFLDSLPFEIARKLEKELPDQKWHYGKDWVNLGYQPGTVLMIQGIARASDLPAHLKSDAKGTPLASLPAFAKVHTLQDIQALVQISSLSGMMSLWVQFFQAGNHRPLFLHGCTSISIPEVYNYLLSGQLTAAHEGVAGAAWHDYLLSEKFPAREPTSAISTNTSLSFAQLVIMAFILLGNISLLGGWLQQRSEERRSSSVEEK